MKFNLILFRQLQIKLDQPVSDPVLPRDQAGPNKGEMATNISAHLQHLRGEVTRLRHQLDVSKKESKFIYIFDESYIYNNESKIIKIYFIQKVVENNFSS